MELAKHFNKDFSLFNNINCKKNIIIIINSNCNGQMKPIRFFIRDREFFKYNLL